jgi:hypothetical protein
MFKLQSHKNGVVSLFNQLKNDLKCLKNGIIIKNNYTQWGDVEG